MGISASYFEILNQLLPAVVILLYYRALEVAPPSNSTPYLLVIPSFLPFPKGSGYHSL
jgi:hypothetical protein